MSDLQMDGLSQELQAALAVRDGAQRELEEAQETLYGQVGKHAFMPPCSDPAVACKHLVG